MPKIETINPSTEKVIATYESMSLEEVSRKVKAARDAFAKWKQLDLAERAEYMRRLGRVMRKNREEYARLVTEEMGKPIRQSLA
ncbi:MAG TPA: aldehyde dehydrogenase family protein, partial [Nitrososphaera sp.]|nr:aldehyde dehydrogenase family protein [Nitrososphaera sp.]